MSWLHVLVFLHVLAAIGGMMFLSAVLAPLVRRGAAGVDCVTLFRAAARRFRVVVWSGIAVLAGTGLLLLHQRGVSPAGVSEWPAVLRIKIILVIALLTLTLSHDLLLGPYARKLGVVPPLMRSSRERACLHLSSWLPRVALLISLGVVAMAVILTRG